MFRVATFCLLLLVSCNASNRIISYTIPTKPVYVLTHPPQKILLLNIYNVAKEKYRDNKEELFVQFIDTMMNWAAEKIHTGERINTEVRKGFTDTKGNTDSTVAALIARYNATHAIAVSSFNVFFEQTHVEVTKDDDKSKSREAFYDIEADIKYLLYSADKLIWEKDLKLSRFHSSRSVISGILAAGPNIVVRKEDAYRIVQENWQQYLNHIIPGEKMLTRPVFSVKGFKAIGQAISRQDYEAALIESLRFVDDPDKEKAAKYCYNCAVFFERKNQLEEAKKYLNRSLRLFSLDEARLMGRDFD